MEVKQRAAMRYSVTAHCDCACSMVLVGDGASRVVSAGDCACCDVGAVRNSLSKTAYEGCVAVE